MTGPDAPWHAHIYYAANRAGPAKALRDQFVAWAETESETPLLFVGRMMDQPVGPHPIPQFEIHFPMRSLPAVAAAIEAAGLRALIHPLTDDDLADHTRLARWIGTPVVLDLSVLDPPGQNQGVSRFGKSDF